MSLYSLNNQEPTELPFRIKLPDGTTRTDPTTFTQEEIAAAGYVIAPDKPAVTSKYTAITWNGTSWDENETRTLQDAISIKLTQLKNVKNDAELNFTFNGIYIKLDQPTQGRINDALKGFDYVPEGTTTPWEVATGIYIDMDKTTLLALGLAGWNHIRDCYINAKSLSDSIQSCTTIAEVDAIDLTTGWP